jgi:hypothetical protein
VEISEEEYAKYNKTLKNGQVVQMTPLKMDSAVAALKFQNEDNDLNLNILEEFVSFMLSCSVLSVDEYTDRKMIDEWAKSLPIEIKRELDNLVGKFITWGTDFTYTVTCKNENCGHERNISTLLNPITFFMTPSGSEELDS